jgi:enoyl-CoA hydratase
VEFQDITYVVEGGVGVITLNRPTYRNAQSYRMLDDIDAAFDLARTDEAARVVLIRGAGGVFSTGHDLGTAEGRPTARRSAPSPASRPMTSSRNTISICS